MSAKEVRMALEARPKNESVAQGSVASEANSGFSLLKRDWP